MSKRKPFRINLPEPLHYESEEGHGGPTTGVRLLENFNDASEQLGKAISAALSLFDGSRPDAPDLISGAINAMLRAADDIENYARGMYP